MSMGYIYLISNDVNDKKYVGQTIRDIYVRFDEHCFDSRSTSIIHTAIQDIGYQHFSIKLLETVDITKLEEREKYWVEYYDAYFNGYNGTPDGGFGGAQRRDFSQIQVVENGLIFNSCRDMARQISAITKWGVDFVNSKIKDAIQNNKPFLDYTLKEIQCAIEQVSSIDDQENWIKTLTIRYCGQRIHCIELNKDFDTITSASAYLLEKGYYQGKSLTPIQSLITDIQKSIKKGYAISSTNPPLSFEKLPGYTKNDGSATEDSFEKAQFFCPQLNITFPSLKIASEIFAKEKIWGNISVKTAKCRISDIARGYFASYKGYTFFRIDKDGSIIEPPMLDIQRPYLIPDKTTIKVNEQIKERIQQDIEKYLDEEKQKQKIKEESVLECKESKALHGTWKDYQELADKYLELGSLGATAKYFQSERSTVKKACIKCEVPIMSAQEWRKKASIPVSKYDLDGNFICSYSSIGEATKIEKFNSDKIIPYAIAHDKEYFGYKWRYTNEQAL